MSRGRRRSRRSSRARTSTRRIRSGGRAGADFDYSGPLTELALLGNLAKRFPEQELLWDNADLKVSNLDDANEFVEDYGTESFTMLWDESFQTWIELGITSQPAAILLAADGTPITGWVGAFPQDETLRLARESGA